MAHTKIRVASIICPAMAVLVTVGSLVGGRPTLAAAHDANAVVAETAAHAASYGTAVETAIVNVKLRSNVTADLRNDRLAVGASPLMGEAKPSVLADLRTTRMFTFTDAERASLSGSSDRASTDVLAAVPSIDSDLSDLDAWYTIEVPAGTDLDAFVRTLSADPNVETAYVRPTAINASIDYTGRQTYKTAAPDGINAAAANRLPGGQGENVTIFDIEGNWDTKHEDLGRAAKAFIANGTFRDNVAGTKDPYRNFDHGTAVLGELIGSANGLGITGIAPKAGIGLVNASAKENNIGIPQAIALAAAHAKPGDVILIEQQYNEAWQTAGQEDLVPVEAHAADKAAIARAVAKGIIVIEAAGNGLNGSGQDLDGILTGPDSGAIMVGAGQVAGCGMFGPGNAARSRAQFSNYGSMVEVQGPGECVVTSGYGDLAGTAHGHDAYTARFAGTSSASPVVAGSAAVLSSIIEERTGRPATPAQVRDLLIKTGTRQDTSVAGHIGPMPDLARALAALPATGGDQGNDQGGGHTGDTTKPVATVSAAPGRGFYLPADGRIPTTVWWGAKDASGIAAYAVKVSTDGAAWTDLKVTSTTAIKTTVDLSAGHTYQFAVAAKDGAGNWGDWTVSAKLSPSLDPDTDANLAYAGTWTRRAWAAAADGSVTATNTAGDTVTISFKARAIGWIASLGTTRGQAHVWLDGKDMGIIDLHRTTTQAQAIVFSAATSAGTTHTLVIEAIGPIDLDGLAFLG